MNFERKRLEEMNAALVILGRNINIAMELYKRMLKNNINKTAVDTP